jgi:hypothetical protein
MAMEAAGQNDNSVSVQLTAAANMELPFASLLPVSITW